MLNDKVRLNSHHLNYEKDYTVELQQYQHEAVTIVQNTIPTPERLVLLFNFIRALNFELERYCQALDMSIDNRVVEERKKNE